MSAGLMLEGERPGLRLVFQTIDMTPRRSDEFTAQQSEEALKNGVCSSIGRRFPVRMEQEKLMFDSDQDSAGFHVGEGETFFRYNAGEWHAGS